MNDTIDKERTLSNWRNGPELEERLQWSLLLWRRGSNALSDADVAELRAHGRIPAKKETDK